MNTKRIAAGAAVGAVAVLGLAACGSDGTPTRTTPVDSPAHTADADTPPTMFDSDTGVLRVGVDIQPGVYTATPLEGEGFYSVLKCWDDTPACYGETEYITEPTAITVPRDAVGLTIAYIELGK